MFKPGDLVITTVHICDCNGRIDPVGVAIYISGPAGSRLNYTDVCVEENEIGLVLENHLDHYTVLFGKKIIRVWNWTYDIKKYEG